MRGMEHQQTHPFPNPCDDSIDNLIRHFCVRFMAPPGEDVRVREDFAGKAMLRLLQSGAAGLKVRGFLQAISDRLMHAGRVEHTHLLVLMLMDILTPDRHSNRFAHLVVKTIGRANHPDAAMVKTLSDYPLHERSTWKACEKHLSL